MPALSGVLSGGSFVPPKGLYPVDWACSGDCAGGGGAEEADEPGKDDEVLPLTVVELPPKAPVGCDDKGVDGAGLISEASLLPKEDVGWNGRTLDPAKPVDCAVRYGAEFELFVVPPLLEKEREEKGPESEVGEVVAEDEEKAVEEGAENALLDVPNGEVGAEEALPVVLLPLARARSDATSANRPPVFWEMRGAVPPFAAAAASFSRCCATNAENASGFLDCSAGFVVPCA